MRIELPQRTTKERPSRLTRYVRARDVVVAVMGESASTTSGPTVRLCGATGEITRPSSDGCSIGASGGKVVGSGAGRGGDEESVGEVVGEEIAVDFRSDIDHGRSVFLQYRHLIERVGPYLLRHRFAFYAQEHAGFGYEAPVAQRVHERDGVGDGGMGEEAEVARVYAEYRDAPVGYPLGVSGRKVPSPPRLMAASASAGGASAGQNVSGSFTPRPVR